MKDRHPLANKVVTLNPAGKDKLSEPLRGAEYRVEDWWQNVYGKSWMDATGNPAALQYAFRMGDANLPLDNNVVYGKTNGLGYIMHVSELIEPPVQEPSQVEVRQEKVTDLRQESTVSHD